jgi:hypothetical protein
LRKRTVFWLAFLTVFIALIAVALVLFLMVAAVHDEGSEDLAREWRTAFLQYPDPAAAVAADAMIVVLKFENGEWAIGKSQDSHGGWRYGGGTLVIRDSHGRTRAFFGHVCGPRFLYMHRDNPSLDRLYEELAEEGFVRFQFDSDAGSSTGPAIR